MSDRRRCSASRRVAPLGRATLSASSDDRSASRLHRRSATVDGDGRAPIDRDVDDIDQTRHRSRDYQRRPAGRRRRHRWTRIVGWHRRAPTATGIVARTTSSAVVRALDPRYFDYLLRSTASSRMTRSSLARSASANVRQLRRRDACERSCFDVPVRRRAAGDRRLPRHRDRPHRRPHRQEAPHDRAARRAPIGVVRAMRRSDSTSAAPCGRRARRPSSRLDADATLSSTVIGRSATSVADRRRRATRRPSDRRRARSPSVDVRRSRRQATCSTSRCVPSRRRRLLDASARHRSARSCADRRRTSTSPRCRDRRHGRLLGTRGVVSRCRSTLASTVASVASRASSSRSGRTMAASCRLNSRLASSRPAPRSSQQRASSTIDARRGARRCTVAAARRQIDLLQEHRQALITAAVTGELEIPGVAA